MVSIIQALSINGHSPMIYANVKMGKVSGYSSSSSFRPDFPYQFPLKHTGQKQNDTKAKAD